MNEATVTLQRCKETNEITPKSDRNFTSVYRKCRNFAKKRLKLYTAAKEMSRGGVHD